MSLFSAIRDVANRRRFERLNCDMPGQLTVGGRVQPCVVKDISLGGAALDREITAEPGQFFTFDLGGTAGIRGRVVNHAASSTRLQFMLDAATQAQVGALLEKVRPAA